MNALHKMADTLATYLLLHSRGTKFKTVEMRGCMAETEYNPRIGKVIGFRWGEICGTSHPYPFVLLQYTDGSIQEWVYQVRDWHGDWHDQFTWDEADQLYVYRY